MFGLILALKIVVFLCLGWVSAAGKLYCLPTDACWPKDTVVRGFAARLTGRLLRPTDAEYRNVTLPKVVNFVKRPGIVVLVKTSGDVRESLEFAIKHNIRVTIFSCGHDFNGRSTADGSLQINFGEMAAITVNEDDSNSFTGFSVKTEAGAEWTKVYDEMDKYNMQITGGLCPLVCVAGYTMGGGHGPLTRLYGLASDNVIAFEIVLYNGTIATCTKRGTTYTRVKRDGSKHVDNSRDTSLFWAVRGGGGGTYGVILSFTFTIHQAPSSVVGVKMIFPVYEHGNNTLGKEMLIYMLTHIPKMSRRWSGAIGIRKRPESATLPSFLFLLFFNGPWGTSSFWSIYKLINYKTGSQISLVMKNYTSLKEYQKEDLKYPIYINMFYINSLIQLNQLNDKESLVDLILGEGINVVRKGTMRGCNIVILGGWLSGTSDKVSAVSTAFRNADLQVACYVAMHPKANHKMSRVDMDLLDQKLTRFSQSSYLNEASYDARDWKRRFWGDKYNDLARIKREVDPHNVFTCHHCVEPDVSGASFIPVSLSIAPVLVFVALNILFISENNHE